MVKYSLTDRAAWRIVGQDQVFGLSRILVE